MDNKFHVSREAARLLKEKGYNEYCNYYYTDKEEQIYYNRGAIKNYEYKWALNIYTAPSKAEAIDWLENKGIVIETYYNRNAEWGFTIARDNFEIYDSWCHDELIFPTRLEAEDAAIIKALELLKKVE